MLALDESKCLLVKNNFRWRWLYSLKTDDSIVTDAVVRYDGSVTWVRPIIYTVTSRHEFRGNSWSAVLKFASWTYDAMRLDLQPLPGSSVGRRRSRSSLNSNEIDSEHVRMDTSSFEPSDLWGLLENRGRLEVCSYRAEPIARLLITDWH